jgi:hypothetical protein
LKICHLIPDDCHYKQILQFSQSNAFKKSIWNSCDCAGNSQNSDNQCFQASSKVWDSWAHHLFLCSSSLKSTELIFNLKTWIWFSFVFHRHIILYIITNMVSVCPCVCLTWQFWSRTGHRFLLAYLFDIIHGLVLNCCVIWSSLLGPCLLLLLFEIMSRDESIFLPWRSYQDSMVRLAYCCTFLIQKMDYLNDTNIRYYTKNL